MSVPAAGRRPGEPVADLDRRVLGAGTTLRFVLLVVLILVSSVVLTAVATPRTTEGVPGTACDLAAGVGSGSSGLAGGLQVAENGSGQAYQECLHHYEHASLPWIAGGIGLMLACALLGFWLLPRWKVRRSRLVPVRDPGLAAELADLVGRAGLPEAPGFVVDTVATTANAVVFGHWRSRTVSLHGGLVARRHDDPEGFRTVVLHELAHIRNGDVGITYAAEALWRAFAVVVLLPAVVVSVFPQGSRSGAGAFVRVWRSYWRTELPWLLQLLLLTALVLLARADVLRTRELYADLDASRWGGVRSLPWTSAGPAPTGGARAALPRFAALWRTHPAWGERAESLLDPAPLFGVRGTTMFLTGAAAIGTVVGIEVVASGLSVEGAWVEPVTAWSVAALVTGIAGVALWRSVVHAVLTGRRMPTGLRAGLWLGLGLAAGELTGFAGFGNGWPPPAPYVLLLLVAGSAALTWWTAQCAALWIGTCRGRSPRRIQLLGLAAMLVVFGGWFDWWFADGYLLLRGGPLITAIARQSAGVLSGSAAQEHRIRGLLPALALLTEVLRAPVLPLSGLLLWLFPLTAWTRRRVGRPPVWAAAAVPGGDLTADRWLGPPPLREALVPGATGGALAVCAMAALRLWLHGQDPDARFTSISALTTTLWLLLALCASVAITAVLAYFRASRHPMMVALCAAGTAMLAGLVGTFGMGATDGCLPATAVLGTTCGWKTQGWLSMLRGLLGPIALGMGAYAVVVVLPLGLLLRGAVARRAARTASPGALPGDQAAGPRGWLAVGGAAAAGPLAVLVARVCLHASRPSAPATPWLLESYRWMAFALTVTVTAAVLIALRVARRRRPRVRTAVAAASAVAATVAGLASAFLLGAWDGCGPDPSVVAAGCAWRPEAGWLAVWLILMPAGTALASCVASAACVAAVVWRAVRGRAARADGAAGSPGRPVLARGHLVLCCAVVVAILSGGLPLLGLGAPHALPGATPVAAPSTAPRTPPAPDEERRRVAAWLTVGGQKTFQKFAALELALSRQIGRTVASGGKVDGAAYAPLCQDGITQGHAALSGLPVPDPALQADWHRIAQQAVAGGTDCLAALRHGDGRRFDRAMGEFSDSAAALSRFGTGVRRLLGS